MQADYGQHWLTLCFYTITACSKINPLIVLLILQTRLCCMKIGSNDFWIVKFIFMNTNLQDQNNSGLNYSSTGTTRHIKRGNSKFRKREEVLQKLNEVVKRPLFSMYYKAKTNDPLWIIQISLYLQELPVPWQRSFVHT